MFENQGVKKFSTLETPKGPKPIFTSTVVHVHAKHSNKQPLTSGTGEWRIERMWENRMRTGGSLVLFCLSTFHNALLTHKDPRTLLTERVKIPSGDTIDLFLHREIVLHRRLHPWTCPESQDPCALIMMSGIVPVRMMTPSFDWAAILRCPTWIHSIRSFPLVVQRCKLSRLLVILAVLSLVVWSQLLTGSQMRSVVSG